MPTVRSLDESEREELTELCDQAEVCLVTFGHPLEDTPTADDVFIAVHALVEQLRDGGDYIDPFEEPDDVAYAVGTLFGQKLAEAAGWEWVYLALDDGFDGQALVPPDRRFALWPHHYIYGLLTEEGIENTVIVLAQAVIADDLPECEPGGLVLLG